MYIDNITITMEFLDFNCIPHAYIGVDRMISILSSHIISHIIIIIISHMCSSKQNLSYFIAIERLSSIRGKIAWPWYCRGHRICPL